MTVPSTLEYGSISVPIFPETGQQGILHTPEGTHQMNQYDFSRFQKPLVKGLIAFAVANLVLGGSIVGFGAYSENKGATWGSMPFFANSLFGIFGLTLIRNFFQDRARDSLSL